VQGAFGILSIALIGLLLGTFGGTLQPSDSGLDVFQVDCLGRVVQYRGGSPDFGGWRVPGSTIPIDLAQPPPY